MDDTAFALQQLAQNVANLTVTVAELQQRVQQLEMAQGGMQQPPQPQPYAPQQRPWGRSAALREAVDELRKAVSDDNGHPDGNGDKDRMLNEGGKEP